VAKSKPINHYIDLQESSKKSQKPDAVSVSNSNQIAALDSNQVAAAADSN